DVDDDTLAPEPPVDHCLVVSAKPLVPCPFSPRIAHLLRLLLIAEQFRLIVRIAEVLDLETLVFVERGQQETELLLEIVEIGYWAVGKVRCLKDEPLRDVAAAAKVIEHDQVAHEKTVGSPLKHCQARFFSFGRTGDANRR